MALVLRSRLLCSDRGAFVAAIRAGKQRRLAITCDGAERASRHCCSRRCVQTWQRRPVHIEQLGLT
jgi:hypothetical protein